MKNLDFSIIIVTYNGYKYINRCVQSIFNSNIKNYEIIVVDNGSSDNSVIKLNKLYSKHSNFNLISLDKNYGPAKARNIASKKAKGKYLGFLDNDTYVDKNFSKPIKPLFEDNKKLGIIQCKLLLANDHSKLDYIGEYLGTNGFLVQPIKEGTLDSKEYDVQKTIFAAKSAGMFIRSSVFKKIGGFDDSFFMYVEETDLGFRNYIYGYTALYEPKSIVYHEFGTSTLILGAGKTSYNAKFHGTKNYIQMHIKNLEVKSLIKILPIHLLLWQGLAWFSLFQLKYKSFLYIYKAIFYNIINLKSTLDKRKVIQKNRIVSDELIFNKIMVKKPLSYYINKVIKIKKVGNAKSF